MNILKLIRDWLEKHFAPAPSELFYIGGSDILPPPLGRDEEERATRRQSRRSPSTTCALWSTLPDALKTRG